MSLGFIVIQIAGGPCLTIMLLILSLAWTFSSLLISESLLLTKDCTRFQNPFLLGSRGHIN